MPLLLQHRISVFMVTFERPVTLTSKCQASDEGTTTTNYGIHWKCFFMNLPTHPLALLYSNDHFKNKS
jgi:hypothetical protein